MRHPLKVSRSGPLTAELVRAPGRFGLGQVPARLAPDGVVRLVCGFCSTGCSLDAHMRSDGAVNLTPTRSSTVNAGRACPKGWEALSALDAADRAVAPLLRGADGKQRRVSWQEALEAFTTRLRGVQEAYGPESVAFISSGQIVTEEMALLGALAKFGMGVVHGDSNTRQCMATSAVAYKQAFGFDAPPYTYDDFAQSDVIVLIGSNLCLTHPIMWEHVCRNPHSPRIVVIDPRVTETASAATDHIAVRPKTDLVLLYGVARELIANGWIDRDFIAASTEGFEAFATHVARFDLDVVEQITGVDADTVRGLAEMIHRGERVSFWWTMGVNQSHEGVRTAQAIINLALITGNIGRPGTGANSVTGQCNAMGSRLFSNTSLLYCGRDFANADDRAAVATTLGIDPSSIPDRPSDPYHEIIEGIVAGKIKALWIIGTNPAHSWINSGHLHDVLDRLDFLVVQDMYTSTETAARADLLLPAAGWGEKEGTFINSERRIGTVKRVRRAPGEALADFSIFKLIADAWGCADLFRDWTSPAAVFAILQRLSAGTPCDFTGIDGYESIDATGGIQWPYPSSGGDTQRERRLFADGRFFTPSQRAKLLFEAPRPVREPVNERYPLTLLTGRGSVAQWHTGTRTSKSPMLRALHPEDTYVELSASDARARGIEPESWVRVTTTRGEMRGRAFVSPTMREGEIFVAMHDAQLNRLTSPSFDPYSHQPSYKHCAAEVMAECSNTFIDR